MTAMSKKRTELVNLQSLMALPVRARYMDDRVVEKVATQARKDPTQIGPIDTAKIESKLYVMTHDEVVAGLREAGISTWRARISHFPTIDEAIIEHVRAILFERAADPLMMCDVVAHLVKSGMDRSEIYAALEMSYRPELADALRCSIAEDARRELRDMMDEISAKTYYRVIPLYYLKALSRLADDRQREAAEELKSLTLSKITGRASFSWLTAETVIFVLEHYRKGGPSTKAGTSCPGGKELPGCKIAQNTKSSMRVNREQVSETLPDDAEDKIFVYRFDSISNALDALGRSQARGTKCIVLTSVPLEVAGR